MQKSADAARAASQADLKAREFDWHSRERLLLDEAEDARAIAEEAKLQLVANQSKLQHVVKVPEQFNQSTTSRSICLSCALTQRQNAFCT